jgi:Fic/DOC family protein
LVGTWWGARPRRRRLDVTTGWWQGRYAHFEDALCYLKLYRLSFNNERAYLRTFRPEGSSVRNAEVLLWNKKVSTARNPPMHRDLTGDYVTVSTVGSETVRAFMPRPLPPHPPLEVSNDVAALEHGLRRLRDGLPLSNRLIREIHGVLLERGRGADKQPGEFRRSQNWVGGSRPRNAVFVPPPADRVVECMGALERWLHDEPEPTPVLLKAALAHVQFETIHPFLDGNGRVGRLLIALLLSVEGVLREPLLYLSLYLKQNRTRYYDLLQGVRQNGELGGVDRVFRRWRARDGRGRCADRTAPGRTV